MAETSTQAVLHVAMTRLGATDHMAFAVRLGIVPERALDPARRREHDRNKARKVSNWLRGINEPLFDDTMRMLSRAGLLQPEAEAAYRGISVLAAAEAVNEAREAAEKQADPDAPEGSSQADSRLPQAE